MNTLRFWHGFAALGALWLSACGGRSQLRDFVDTSGGGGSGGSGGFGGTTTTTTTTSSDSSSSGVGGGFQGPCAELTYQTPFASLQGSSDVHQRAPRLAYSTDDGAGVTVATGWQVVESPSPNPPTELRHTSLAPWVTFPAGAGLGPTYLADFDGGASFAIAKGSGGKFALLFRDFQQPPPGGLRFSDQFKPASGDVPPSLLVDTSARTALFLTRGQKTFSFGAALRQGDTREIRAGVIAGNSFVETILGCANGPVEADALPVGDDALFVAYATGTEAASGGCDVGAPGPPNRLQLAQLIGGTLAFVGEVTVSPSGGTTGPLTDIRFAPRTDGGWMVWSNPGSNIAPPSLVLGKLTTPVGELQVLTEVVVPYVPGSVAVTSFDNFLVLAWVQSEPEGASPHVQVFDPDGNALGDIQIAATGAAQGRLSLLGSPFGHSAVLAWSETGAGPNDGDQVRLTRIDCIDKK